MKKIFPIILALPLFFSCAKDQSTPIVEEVDSITLTYQERAKPLVFEITSTGCPGCGSWGKPVFSQLSSQYGNQIIPVAVHIKYGDPYITNVSENIAANRYGAFYTPQIWVNDTNGVVISAGGGSIQTESSIKRMNDLIGRRLLENTPYLSGTVYEEHNNLIKFKVGVNFNGFEPGPHSYSLSTYLLESDLENYQNGSMSNPTKHDHVIRQSFGDTWGAEVKPQDWKFEYKGVFELDEKNDNQKLVIILWRKQANRYESVGAYSFR